MNNKYEEIIRILGEKRVRRNVSLADYTTFKIGGPADLFYEVETEEELVRILGVVREIGVPYFVLGNGSKILISDKGFRGLVIKLSNNNVKINGVILTAEAGVQMSVLLDRCIEELLSGLEFMAGIPATIGGAVRGNAGAWQKNIGDLVKRVKVIDGNGSIKWFGKEECIFNYRDSRFKHSSEIILEVEIQMDKGDKKEIEEKINDYLEKRKGQPKELSVGCIFINPKPQSAGELIEKCGLKGKRIGDAIVSDYHANFIINIGKATAKDVVCLIELIKVQVREKYGVELVEEVVRIGGF